MQLFLSERASVVSRWATNLLNKYHHRSISSAHKMCAPYQEEVPFRRDWRLSELDLPECGAEGHFFPGYVLSYVHVGRMVLPPLRCEQTR